MLNKLSLLLIAMSLSCSVSAGANESAPQGSESSSLFDRFFYGPTAPACHDYPHCLNGPRGARNDAGLRETNQNSNNNSKKSKK